MEKSRLHSNTTRWRRVPQAEGSDVQSARGLAQAKSFAISTRCRTARERLGVRQSSGAFTATEGPINMVHWQPFNSQADNRVDALRFLPTIFRFEAGSALP